MRSLFVFTLCLFSFLQCAYFFPESSSKESKSPKRLYSECMETFADDTKCKEFVLKSIPDADISLLGKDADPNAVQASNTIFIREELVRSLLYQNKLFVKNKLGEPDEKRIVNNWAPGMEEWLYYRPVSKFAEGSRPDREILIRFQRGAVVHVGYTPPSQNR
ncbi:hypothetical protein [Leptospira licerasiae]|uniref:Lipoprotein n=1 Tax=Leptospira licerasiae str. MMD4847 TaxID=1049971 RepID=A0ABP2RBL6_9LEPT|nr:hypothetical protein [Leptospira licerasiae]EIE00163.1 hypothetical protein LEP1GSC185_2747 [Leptospira licerasiae serovar Varillal str. VAR 010]EJZ41971.1 hypothetical protein LEP1GSC178_0521 [Leptospira licerasiae str. MMD4847]